MCIRDRSKLVEQYTEIAKVKIQLGQFQDAVTLLDRVVPMEPDSVELRDLHIKALKEAGELERAAKAREAKSTDASDQDNDGDGGDQATSAGDSA